MSSATDQYIRRLEDELRDVPRARRRELVEEIEGHIEEGQAAGHPEREILDQLGDPEDIAAEARERFGVETKRMGALEILTVILLLVGGVILPVLGWVVGVVLLWVSQAWTTRDKWVGTLVVPGGMALGLGIFLLGTSVQECSGEVGGELTCSGGDIAWGWLILGIAGLAGPVFTMAYLINRARRPAKIAAY
jgi:uncharacterized membrane protein